MIFPDIGWRVTPKPGRYREMKEAHIPPSPFGASTTKIATILDSHISTPSYAKMASIIRLCVEEYLSPRQSAIPLRCSKDVAGQGSGSFRAVQNLHLQLSHSPLSPVRYYAAYYILAYAMITNSSFYGSRCLRPHLHAAPYGPTHLYHEPEHGAGNDLFV